MDSFQLQRAIYNVEANASEYMNLEKDYKPFLGVVNYDLSGKLVKRLLKHLCKSVCCDKIYFMVVNTSLSSQEGEHWFVLAFERGNRNAFYSFNSYGLVNTLRTLEILPKTRTTNDGGGKARRLYILYSLAENIWGNNSNNNDINLIGLNGIHQDFSTDECGYHLFRFVTYLYDKMSTILYSPLATLSWKRVLQGYLLDYTPNTYLLAYDNKNLTKHSAQPILLANDKLVRRFCEQKNNIEDPESRIEIHEEYKLTEGEWNNKAQEYVNSFKQLTRHKTIFSSSNLVLSTAVAVPTAVMTRTKTTKDRRKRGGGKIKRKESRKKFEQKAKRQSYVI